MNKPSKSLPKGVGCVIILLVLSFITMGKVITASAAPSPSSVNVVNPASQPVPVREMGPALEPFQASEGGTFSNGVDSHSFVLVTVPSGKRLIIEYATVSGFASEGVKLGASISTTAGGTTVSHQLVVTDQGSINDPVTFAAAQPMRLYADPGTNVIGIVYRTPNAFGGGAGITISGYFVNVP